MGDVPGNGMLAPVAIGGVGGSGTRVVAELVRNLGIHTGTDLNDASDTLWFTLLFKRLEAPGCPDGAFDALVHALVSALAQGAPLDAASGALVRSLASPDRPQHPADWLQLRAASLLAAAAGPAHGRRWGWKEPNTHVVIERLWQRLPELRYIHVVRDGLQMATSRNQNQLRLWGPQALGEDGPATPRRSLAYWCHVHRRMQRLLALNPQRMLWLDYDRLCADPRAVAPGLARFLGHTVDEILAALPPIRPPSAREIDADDGFDPADLVYARSLRQPVHDPPATRPAAA